MASVMNRRVSRSDASSRLVMTRHDADLITYPLARWPYTEAQCVPGLAESLAVCAAGSFAAPHASQSLHTAGRPAAAKHFPSRLR